MDAPGGGRIELAEARMRRGGAALVVEPLPALARARRRRRRQRELGERGAEVQARAAHHERRPSGREDLVDRRVSERRVLADRRDVRERPDADEPLGIAASGS